MSELTLPCSGSVGPFSIARLGSVGADFSLKTLQELNKTKLTFAVCISWKETYLNPVGVQMSSDTSLMGHSIEIINLDMRIRKPLQISDKAPSEERAISLVNKIQRQNSWKYPRKISSHITNFGQLGAKYISD
jgi:hypothetical protein